MKKFFLVLLICFWLPLLLGSCASQNSPLSSNSRPGSTQAEVHVSQGGADAAEPAIAADGNGNIYVAYVEHTGKAADVYLQKFDREMKPAGERVRINPTAGEVKAWRGDQPT